MNKITKLIKSSIIIACLLWAGLSFAQVGVGTTSPTDGSILDVSSTTKGLMIPNVNITDLTTLTPVIKAGASPEPISLLVWNTNTTTGVGFHYWDGNDWISLSGGPSSNDWTITGNTGHDGGNVTTPGTNFIGTTDNQNMDFRTNNIFRGRFSSLGEFFVGTTQTIITGDLMNGVSNATFPWAINGYSDFNGGGVYGSVLTGSTIFGGVQGEYAGTSDLGAGVRGIYLGTGLGVGINGQYTGLNAGLRIGVLGESIAGAGNQQIGVLGQYDGVTGWGLGVVGIAAGGGVPAGNNDIGIVGWRANNSNYSGYFNGNHVIANGTKSASVGTSKGNQLLYVTESPEVWFEDYGRAKLINGYAEVQLDPLFLETVFIDDEHPIIVFLQEEGESNGIYVVVDKDKFSVREKNNGSSNISFTYKIMAKRLHFQDHRFGNDPVWGEGDTRKYSYYATPPPVDYNENVRFQEEQKRNYKPTPMPDGFITYLELYNKMKTKTSRPKKVKKEEDKTKI